MLLCDKMGRLNLKTRQIENSLGKIKPNSRGRIEILRVSSAEFMKFFSAQLAQQKKTKKLSQLFDSEMTSMPSQSKKDNIVSV